MELKRLLPRRPLPADIFLIGAWMAGIGLLAGGCHPGNKNGNDNGQAGEGNNVEERIIPAYYKYMQGTIGQKKRILQLLKYNDRYDGILIDSLGEPLNATGARDSSGELTLVTYRHYDPVDTFTGTFPQPGVFQGFWSDTAGRHSPFVFQEIYPEGTYRWEVYALKDSLAFDSAGQSPMARTQMSLLWPDGKTMNETQRRLIADTIVKRYLNNNASLSDGKAVLHTAADSFFYSYKQLGQDMRRSKDQRPGGTFNWELESNMAVLWNAGNIVSVAFRNYQYTGGAHGLGTTLLTVFDLKENRALTLNDLFKPGYKARLQKVLEDELREEFQLPPGAPLNGRDGILFDKHLAITKNFYLTGEGIGFIYNPYEVAPYVVGQIDLFVPFSRIGDILRNRE